MLVRTGNLNIQKRIFDSKILQTKYKHFNHIFGIYQNTNAYQNNVNVNDNVNVNVNERWYFHFVEVPT